MAIRFLAPLPLKLFDEILRRALIRQALFFAEELHWGEIRFVTKKPYIFHPVSVARRYARLFPNDNAGIAACLLHDTRENAHKLVKRILDHLDEHKSSNKRTAQLFVDRHIPPLFREYARRAYHIDFDNDVSTEKLRALKEKLAEPDAKKRFARFVTYKIPVLFGKEVAELVYILTRISKEKAFNNSFVNKKLFSASRRLKAATAKSIDFGENLGELDFRRNLEHAVRTIDKALRFIPFSRISAAPEALAFMKMRLTKASREAARAISQRPEMAKSVKPYGPRRPGREGKISPPGFYARLKIGSTRVSTP